MIEHKKKGREPRMEKLLEMAQVLSSTAESVAFR